LRKIIIGAVIVSLITTPWVSSDALIIPKIIVLACLSSFLLPELIKMVVNQIPSKKLKILTILSIIFVIQMLVSAFKSAAPFEQQFFGVTGRGLGFITYFSLFIIMLYTAFKITYSDLSKISYGLLISCSLSSVYSILQFFGYDFSDWRTQTNGIIGTIGNPNFQSSFVAIAFLPTIVYLWNTKIRILLISLFSLILLFTLYICESTQGYIALATSSAVFILIYLWYKQAKFIFIGALLTTTLTGSLAVAGMLNHGPLSHFLYKVSVRSRGEMWQTATAMISNNKLFGVGLDSLGDYSLKYRNKKTATGIAEYIDNCHNFFLQFAATGGVLLAICYVAVILLSLFSFYRIQRSMGKFDETLAALLAAWVSFQLQSLISPAAMPTLIWNFILCGAFVGLGGLYESNTSPIEIKPTRIKINSRNSIVNIVGVITAIFAFALTIPLFNADKLARQADIKKDASLAIKAANTYPKSVIRFNRLGGGLYESRLYDLSLEIGRSAVKFNPNNYQTWILILLNPKATSEERNIAKQALIQIDPYNDEIKNYKF